MFVKKVNDMKIPILGLGTFQVGGKTCKEAVMSVLNMGYRHIDTAAVYGNEEEVGEGIKESDVDREEIFVTTKVPRKKLQPDDLVNAAEESLDRLDMDYVDLLLMHWDTANQAVPMEESLGAMRELKEKDKTKHIGVSNFTLELLQEALQIEPSLTCNQVEMHPMLQQRKILDFCRENNLILTAYSPLARGDVMENPNLQEIADKYDRTPAQVSLRWLIQQYNVVAIPKSSKESHQKENLQAINFHLEDGDMEKIYNIEETRRKVDPGFAPW